jgi:DNA-binding response OmpR family regulator
LLRDLIVVCLESQGYAVLKARNHQEAIFFSEEFPGEIHLLLLDAGLSLLDARQTLERLKIKRPEVKGLFLCGPFKNEALQKDVNPAGVILWPKPFSPTELLAGVHGALGVHQVDTCP